MKNLNEFITEANKHIVILYLEKEDMKNYSILIHSLKSSSKMIGADMVSALAKDLEDASKKDDLDFVQINHDNFIESFKALAAKISG